VLRTSTMVQNVAGNTAASRNRFSAMGCGVGGSVEKPTVYICGRCAFTLPPTNTHLVVPEPPQNRENPFSQKKMIPSTPALVRFTLSAGSSKSYTAPMRTPGRTRLHGPVVRRKRKEIHARFLQSRSRQYIYVTDACGAGKIKMIQREGDTIASSTAGERSSAPGIHGPERRRRNLFERFFVATFVRVVPHRRFSDVCVITAGVLAFLSRRRAVACTPFTQRSSLR